MFGLIIGIVCFFIGAIISTVFASSSSNLFSYKISSSIKLLGIGAVISSMIIGGVYIENIDKNIRLLLLLLGLVLLMIYTIGSQSLEWYIPTSQTPTGNESYEHRPTGYGIPGFELPVVLGALAIAILVRRIRRKR